MEEQDRRDLVSDLLAALEQQGLHTAAGTLFDLMRTEQNLVDALRVIRRLIELVLATGQAGS